MADCGQPGWSSVAGIGLVVGGENTPDSVFIQIQSKSKIDLLGDSGTAEARVATLHLDNGVYHFVGGPPWPGFASTAWCIKLSIFSLLQSVVKTKQGRWFDNNG